MIQKIIFLVLVSCMMITGSFAQLDNNRTVTTRIADLLAMLPAESKTKLQTGMQEIGEMGKPGIIQLASMLAAAGKGDDSKVEYALGGYTFFVSQPGKEEWRKTASEAYCEALLHEKEKENQQFLIYQLQIIGKDECVATVKTFLADEYLCGPAARALAKISTTISGNALLSSMKTLKGNCRLSIVEALGDAKFKDAAAPIESFVNTTDEKAKQVSLYALANIAAVSSGKILAAETQKAGYTYVANNATAAYLHYLSCLAANGNKTIAEKEAMNLYNNASAAKQIHTQMAALKLLMEIRKQAGVLLLIKAMESNDAKFRAAALKFALPYTTNASTALWVSALKKVNPTVQAEIIDMLGQMEAKSALTTVLAALKSKDANVKLAAIKSAGQIGNEKALPSLLLIMQKGNAAEINAVKNALLVMKGPTVVDKIANAKGMPATAGAALMDVLAARGAGKYVNLAFAGIKSSDANLKASSFAALKQMATGENLDKLFTVLLADNTEAETKEVQSAIIHALKGADDADQRSAPVLKQVSNVSENKKVLFFPVLAGIGGTKSLGAVTSAYNSGSYDLQKATVEALSKWSDAGALDFLYTIAETTKDDYFLDQAVKGYVRSINITQKTPTQKVLMLRKGMEVAKTLVQKDVFINELQRHKTFNAMVFAGQYLDDPDLQQAAAETVMLTALANKDFQGDVVRKLLNKVLQVMKGKDAEYKMASVRKHLAEMPTGEGFVSLFNGKDLTGWKGLVGNPITRAKMHPDTLALAQSKADVKMKEGWTALNGDLVFNGHGDNLCTVKQYGDFEMYVDWKIEKNGDAGIYLRGSPQVQIWDTSRRDVGAQVGSGGLYNNKINSKNPLKLADNAIGDWNTLYIVMKGDRVTVKLNGELVVDNTVLENYWNRNLPIFAKEQIELQAHGELVAYRDIYIRELSWPEPFVLSEEEKKEGYKVLFDGTNMYEWLDNPGYVIENGNIVYKPALVKAGANLMTKDEYSDFVFRFEFQLTPGANNGLGIRVPLEGDAAYQGMEIQILDDGADIYKNLEQYQYHGSVYGIIPAKRGFLKSVGEWNKEEVEIKGTKIKVTLNGEVIIDGDITEASRNGTLDKRDHPGLKRDRGHIGFLGHGSVVQFRNIRVKDLSVNK